MSLDASRWAWQQQVGKSSAKLVLLSLADLADEQNLSWPSIKHLELDTELNRKTIIDSLAHLERNGFLMDTGDRKGRTGQVKVYQLIGVQRRHHSSKSNSTKTGTVSAEQKKAPLEAPPAEGFRGGDSHEIANSTEINTLSETPQKSPLKEAQNRKSSESGTVPVLRGKSPVFTPKESQKRDTDPTNEPISEPLSSQHQEKNASDADSEFAMTFDWWPDHDRFLELLDLRGIPNEIYTQEALNEFRGHWFGCPERLHRQELWEHKLASSLIEFEAKRLRREASHVMPSNFGEFYGRRQVAGGALDS